MENLKKINIRELSSEYFIYGNKGNVWSNTAHAYKTGFGEDSGNLCKTLALANNHARWNDIEEVGCIECLEIIYKNKLNKFPLQK
jgi:hypothetical protein